MGAERDRGVAGGAARAEGTGRGRATRSGRSTSRRARRTSRRRGSGWRSKSCSSTRRSWPRAKRAHRTARPAPRLGKPGETVGRWMESLPFEPTGDQLRAFDEIDADLDSGEPMQRLLMGEVGYGKTVVGALLDAAGAGSRLPGGADGADRDAGRAACGDAGQAAGGGGDPVRAADRGDAGAAAQASARSARQRRAGVDRRHPCADRAHGRVRPAGGLRGRRAAPLRGRAAPGARLEGGGGDGAARPPHDRDADPAHALADRLRRSRHDRAARAARRAASRSRPGWSSEDEREGAYEFIRAQLREGRQAYVVCPLVEESEKMQGKAAEKEAERLAAGELRDFEVGVIHGQMPSAARRRRWRPSSPARPTCWSRPR